MRYAGFMAHRIIVLDNRLTSETVNKKWLQHIARQCVVKKIIKHIVNREKIVIFAKIFQSLTKTGVIYPVLFYFSFWKPLINLYVSY